ncbi:metallohydrolase [Asticcacaulis sp.]|uniref:metallohydrolase n=1 Tax=Asticcacaulis sp. TaxID=1872648 RepID=UPI003918D6AB
MTAKLCFFGVGCGDMTLITTSTGKTILVDCHIRTGADDPDNDECPDVGAQLRDRLKKDDKGRYYVDAMVLSHPDKDHCGGLMKHFHLGAIADCPENSQKIIIREMWSSPIVFRRAGKKHVLCEDAKAWAAEARRRVKYYRTNGWLPVNERILIIGEDVDGKTDDLANILVRVDGNITSINNMPEDLFDVRVIGPLPIGDDDEEEELSKNDSSIILRFKIGANYDSDACRFLTGGDAEVGIWERVWDRNKGNIDNLKYDVLLSPHHCSWHSLSWDSWSKKGEDAEVSDDARSALSQARRGAKIIASSKPITDDDKDPPCIRAKREYKAILKEAGGTTDFVCVGDSDCDPIEYKISSGGVSRSTGRAVATGAAAAAAGTAIGTSAFAHGDTRGHG